MIVDDGEWVYLARVERDITGGITLHLIPDEQVVEVRPGNEYVTARFVVDPFNLTRPS